MAGRMSPLLARRFIARARHVEATPTQFRPLSDPLPSTSAYSGSWTMQQLRGGGAAERSRRALPTQWRGDASGRVIPHEFVVFGDLANDLASVENAVRLIW